jgi:hypothetical protein
MKRWATHLFIAAYLGALGLGLAAHALTFLKSSHPAMYFIVWDMYCGWTTYEIRMHILGEGDSGNYYELSPGPWGDFRPFGGPQRQDYDAGANFGYSIAANTLAQTEHEPIRRIVVVEEAWPKKYNLSSPLWERQYGTPKPSEPYSYFHVRSIYNAAGAPLAQAGPLLGVQLEALVLDNPELRSNLHRGRPFYATDPRGRRAAEVQPVGYEFESR